MNVPYQSRDDEYDKQAEEIAQKYVIMRSGTLCPGCPHKATFWVIKNALRLDGRYGFVTGASAVTLLAWVPVVFPWSRPSTAWVLVPE
jgi:indolepyruvate ferredoxin oxidoreductase alpha subunit